jgi:hypothetical protein
MVKNSHGNSCGDEFIDGPFKFVLIVDGIDPKSVQIGPGVSGRLKAHECHLRDKGEVARHKPSKLGKRRYVSLWMS